MSNLDIISVYSFVTIAQYVNAKQKTLFKHRVLDSYS